MTTLMVTKHKSKWLSMETMSPNHETCTILATDTTHWICNSYTLLFQAIDHLADFMPLLTMMMPPMTTSTACHTPNRSNNTTPNLSNQTSLTQPTAEFANSTDNNFVMMIPMPLAIMTSLTPLSDSHISDSDAANQTTCHSKNTTHWIRDSFD